jgi:uncharacterized protein YceK
MKKISAALLVILLAGCSGMGMRSNSSGGMGTNYSSGTNSDSSMNSLGVIDPRTGNLATYHGG